MIVMQVSAVVLVCSADSASPSVQMAALITLPFRQGLRSTAPAYGMAGGTTPVHNTRQPSRWPETQPGQDLKSQSVCVCLCV